MNKKKRKRKRFGQVKIKVELFYRIKCWTDGSIGITLRMSSTIDTTTDVKTHEDLFSFRLSTNNKIVKDNRCEDLEKQIHRFQPTPHAEENSLVDHNTNDVSKVERFFEIKLIVEICNENHDV